MLTLTPEEYESLLQEMQDGFRRALAPLIPKAEKVLRSARGF
jgi:hypothetical protein